MGKGAGSRQPPIHVRKLAERRHHQALVTGTDAGSRAATWVEELSTKRVGPHPAGMFAGDVREPDGSDFMVATRDGPMSGNSGDPPLLGLQVAPTICVRAIKIA